MTIRYPQVECSWRNKIKVPSQCMFEEAHSYRLLATLHLESRSTCQRLGFQPETLLGDDGHWPHGRNLGIEGRGLEADIEPLAFLFASWPPWGEQLPLPHVLPWRTVSPQTQSHHALKPWVPGAKTNLSSLSVDSSKVLHYSDRKGPNTLLMAHIWPLLEGAYIQFAKILKCHHLQLPKEFFN